MYLREGITSRIMNGIDGRLLFDQVDHGNFTHATATLAGSLALDGLRSSEDPWIASMPVASATVALPDGGFGVVLRTATAYDKEVLEDIAGSECRTLTIEAAGRAAMHPSVEFVVAALRSGAMARSAR